MRRCVDHLEYTDAVCPDCGAHVDPYGNTEDQFDHCCFPDCGCDGERLCMAPSGASGRARHACVEGMWSGTGPEQVAARQSLIVNVMKERIRRG